MIPQSRVTIKVHLLLFPFCKQIITHYYREMASINEPPQAFLCLSFSLTLPVLPVFCQSALRGDENKLFTGSICLGSYMSSAWWSCLRQHWSVSLRTNSSAVRRSSGTLEIINHPFICLHTLSVSMRSKVTRTRTRCV